MFSASWIRAVGIGALLMLVWVIPAAAHGGTRVYADTVGPYFVEIYTLRLANRDGDDLLDYTVSLRAQGSRRPVDGAAVTVRAETPAGEELGPFEATAFVNQYQALIPVHSEGIWTVDVDISGPAGDATLTHPVSVASEAGWHRLLTSPLPFLLFTGITVTLVAGMLWHHGPDEAMRDGESAVLRQAGIEDERQGE